MKLSKGTNKKRVQKKTVVFFMAAGFILCLFVFVLFIFQRKTYVTADLFISGGEWWWITADPPYWLSNPVLKGAAEYDIKGQKLVEVLSVEKFDQPIRKTMMVRARLLVTKNLRTKKYRFKQTPLEVGATIAISPGNIEMFANVMGIEGVQGLSPQQTKTITVRWYNVFPWQADAIHVGDVMKDGANNEVARILKKDVAISEKTIVTENTQAVYGISSKQAGQLVILRSDPLRRDVTMVMEIMTSRTDDQYYFGVVQRVKVGEMLYVSLPDIFINPTIISLTGGE